jgi:hypothetical protein
LHRQHIKRKIIIDPVSSEHKKAGSYIMKLICLNHRVIFAKKSMKKIAALWFLCLSVLFASAQKDARLNEGQATIYIYRGGQFTGAAANWALFVDGKKICKLSNNKFIKVTLPPGKHVITSKIGGVELFKKETVIEVETEGGKSYYVACTVKQSFTRARMEFMEVTKSTADKQMEGMSLDNCQESIDAEK